MKVIRLRTHYGVPALKGENAWGVHEPGTELRMLPCGHFVVSKYGKNVLIPGAAVQGAEVEPEKTIDAIAEEKRGPGRPKKDVASE